MEAEIPSSHSHFRTTKTIAKSKPKIRITHIFAPEVIKTDVANFRELVQRLTGKPFTEDRITYRVNKRKEVPSRVLCSSKKVRGSVAVLERIKEEIWPEMGDGCFLSGFSGGFMEEFDEFSFIEGTVSARMDVLSNFHDFSCHF